MKQSLSSQVSKLVQQLSSVRLSEPFNALGLHAKAKGKGLVLRAWQPDAKAITVMSLNGEVLGTMSQLSPQGLFELEFDAEQHFSYQLEVEYVDSKLTVIDPYQFTDLAYDGLATMTHAPQNLYQVLGAQVKTIEVDGVQVKGVRFGVYAPSASSVSLIGDFNHWDGRRLPMQRSLDGHWVLFVPGLDSGTKYKYELKDRHGHSLPHKTDPVGFSSEQYPSFASVVWDHDQYQWNDEEWIRSQNNDKRHQPMSVYEVHLGSWRRKVEATGNNYLSYRELAVELVQYVKEMGYTHIEVLPVSEFPFDGSWGYQPIGLFAPTSRFGNPDDFKFLVDQCHQNGIGVIVDWVPAHFPSDSHGLAQFDGTHLYEYEDPRRGWHNDWNSYIYDFGRDNVRQFLVASALIWLDKFHVDGLRVDAVASMLYWDYSREEGEWVPNVDGGNHNYEAISLLKWFNEEVYRQYPHAMTIAEESTAFAGVSRPTFTGGLGFGFKWNMGWMHDSLDYMQKDPAFRKYHHNEITFAMVYNYDENFVLPISHDEVVHGKGSLLGKMPGDEWQQAANLRAYTAFMYAHPGKKLNFMGNEIAQASEWNHDSSLEWNVLEYPKHKGQQELVKQLNKVYREHPAMFEGDYDTQGFEWIDHDDWEKSVLVFQRNALNSQQKVIVVSNFTPVPRDNYRLAVPEQGRYRIILNSDSEMYWGGNYDAGIEFQSEAVASHGRENSVILNLPPLSTLYLIKVD
ncbi:1,4-alpha-glucan branching protein GlgB [Agarivorans aestuarii]|uniref:1,4-alpha-glucan branching enzyme GlgB n=1 Tax=Agarivorans aestuarii TaxID=1563703 RepID=A0ABU7FZ91_9ALTE|nr:1,4-alpha-glucan branching protein GlgB [Agarivorans aestuarii]MEE1672374.1 1,4-alpha-glucan branching protein GlgB [Agarivorans aestuarii]